MLVIGLFIATAVLYGIASGLYLVFLMRGRQGIGRITNASLGAAVLCHVAFLITEMVVEQRSPFFDIQSTLAVLSLGTVIGFLIALARYPITVLGAFITPVTLLMFLGSAFGRGVAQVPPEIRSALLPVHIGVNVLGLVAFAVAFGASVAYVLQERLLRKKNIGGIFQRLPALDVLDSVSFRAVMVGFPLFTAGVVTGAVWAVKSQPGGLALSTTQNVGLLTWTVFAAVLLLRVAAGWRGRRAALGTIMGFVCAMAVLVGYVVQARNGA